MLSGGLLWLLAMQAPAEATNDDIRSTLVAARARTEVAEACAGADTITDLQQRYYELRSEALGVAPYVDPTIADLGPRDCVQRTGQELRLAAGALDRLAAATARRLAAMQGLWLGPLPLCGGAVTGVEASFDEMGEPNVLIHFSPAMTRAVGEETARRVNAQLPVVLDGRILVAPIVREPILGGVISVAGGGSLPDAETMRRAAALPCPD